MDSKWNRDTKEESLLAQKKPHISLHCTVSHLMISFAVFYRSPISMPIKHSNLCLAQGHWHIWVYCLRDWHFNKCFLTVCSQDTYWLWHKLLTIALMDMKISKEPAVPLYKLFYFPKLSGILELLLCFHKHLQSFYFLD